MDNRPIHNEADYHQVLREASALVDLDPSPESPAGERLDVIATLIRQYESRHHAMAAAGDLVPDAVVKLAFDNGLTPVKAWRTHLELAPDEVARRLDITQSADAQLEASIKLPKSSRERIATALDISAAQLDF